MRSTTLTITFIFLSIISNSQIITVSVKGLQMYFRPKNLTLQECQQQNLLSYKNFGIGDCDYIFDLNKHIFKMVIWNGDVYEHEILNFEKTGDNWKIQVGQALFFITNQTELKETIFLIEYYDLDNEIEGRFAKEKDFTMTIE